LLTFANNYYGYDGECEIKDKGLTIGGYKSAWLADLVAAFVFKKTANLFSGTVYDGIYRDNGLGNLTLSLKNQVKTVNGS
jgi:hypothetical protein